MGARRARLVQSFGDYSARESCVTVPDVTRLSYSRYTTTVQGCGGINTGFRNGSGQLYMAISEVRFGVIMAVWWEVIIMLISPKL